MLKVLVRLREGTNNWTQGNSELKKKGQLIAEMMYGGSRTGTKNAYSFPRSTFCLTEIKIWELQLSSNNVSNKIPAQKPLNNSGRIEDGPLSEYWFIKPYKNDIWQLKMAKQNPQKICLEESPRGFLIPNYLPMSPSKLLQVGCSWSRDFYLN